MQVLWGSDVDERDGIGWALARLRPVVDRNSAEFVVDLQTRGGASPEAFEVVRLADGVRVFAGDRRGFVLGLLELAERFELGLPVDVASPGATAPVRGLQRSFGSYDEDLGWFLDRDFWTEYLDWLAVSRFNRFHLAFGMGYNYGADTSPVRDNYLCFVYPFLLDVPGTSVRAQGVDSSERRRNLEQLRFIARETVYRGMDFQLGLWNHAYDYGRSASGAFADQRFAVLGLSSENHAQYSSLALAQLLEEIPEITGVSLRVHYEGGIHDLGHEAFWGTVFDGIASVGRPIQVDMHAKGVDQALLEAVSKPGLQPVLSAKYWAEHMGLPYHQAAIRPREQNEPIPPGRELDGITEFSRRFTRYGYADFLRVDRPFDVMFRIWPGTSKVLMSADPTMAAAYARTTTIGGALGLDLCEPLFFKGRKGSGVREGKDPYADPELRLGDDIWRKYRYTYAVWGRMLHDADLDPARLLAVLEHDVGTLAAPLADSLAAASRILPLITTAHCPAASNNRYSPELGADVPISPYAQSPDYGIDTDGRATWGGVSPLDSELFRNADAWADEVVAGRVPAAYGPIDVATWLEQLVSTARAALDPIRSRLPGAPPQAKRLAIDIDVLAQLGLYYAHKLRGALEYAIWERTNDRDVLASAVDHARAARDEYDAIVGIVDGNYAQELVFGPERHERGHWRQRHAELATDLSALEHELERASEGPSHALSFSVLRGQTGVRLSVPATFTDREDVRIEVEGGDPTTVELRYRAADQSARWQSLAMTEQGSRWSAAIPAQQLDARFPLLVYAIVRSGDATVDLVPGLDPPYFSTQPYVVLMPEQDAS